MLLPPLLTRLWTRTRDLWRRARREHSTPREVGWSVAVGVFCGCSPFIGLHMWLAIGLATAFKLNRLWAFLGSRVSVSVLLAWIAFSEVELAYRLRAGEWMPLKPDDVLVHGWQLFGDWLVGSLIVGGVLGASFGLVAYGLARRWRREDEAAASTPRTPAGPLPPSSGSRPSTPPAPTS
jgi:uncharacterized protein (DUF2062 family)